MNYEVKSEQEEQTTTNENPWLKPGIHEVKVTKIVATEEDGKTPRLDLTFENREGKIATGTLYFSELAKQNSTKNIGFILNAVGVKSLISGKNLTEMAKNLEKSLSGKFFRHRFVAEEIQGKEGKSNWFKAKMGFKYSTESISTTPSKLKELDRNNPYDYKTLAKPDSFVSETPSSDDLPF